MDFSNMENTRPSPECFSFVWKKIVIFFSYGKKLVGWHKIEPIAGVWVTV